MNPKNKYRNCPLCGSSYPSLYLSATSKIPTSARQVQVTEKYFGFHGDMVKCNSCGFTYIGEDSYVEKVVSLYKNMSDEVYLQEEKERKLSFMRVLKTLEKLNGRKKGKILDIGCCTGGLLVEAKKRGWDVYGVDPSDWACQMAQRYHGLKIYNGQIETYNPKRFRFDVITMLDVLEHVVNPKLILNKTHALLKDDGLFCIVTPNFGSLTAKILGKKWWGVRLAHLSYFRYKDLHQLFQTSGFKIIKSNTYTRYFSLYYILVRIFPIIEELNIIKNIMKKFTLPLILFDTFELYLRKEK